MELSRINIAPCFLGTAEFGDGEHHHHPTGYLEDALIGFSSTRSKRRRLEDPSYYYENFGQDAAGGVIAHVTDRSVVLNGLGAAAFVDERKEAIVLSSMAAAANFDSSSSSSSPYKVELVTRKQYDQLCGFLSKGTSSLQAGKGGAKRDSSKTRVKTCPFGLVKPGGMDGDVTLKDINKRILRPPTRPVRHPVGEYASRPWVSPDGPGLSGKAVVALTRIHTQGTGTITIIRTKG